MAKRGRVRARSLVEEYAAAIKIPAEDWAGRCYEIACAILRAGLVKGEARYGHWVGPIHPESLFAGRGDIGFTHHGWIEVNDVTVLDPTRWVFEHVKPYIFLGPPDHYDLGNQVLFARRGPPPAYDPSQPQFDWPPIQRVIEFLGYPPYSMGQIIWLANVPPQVLGEAVQDIYARIITAGWIGFIPIDNRSLVYGNGNESPAKDDAHILELIAEGRWE